MKSIKHYLNGEFGLGRTFWFGLVLGGSLLALLGNLLQSFVWYFYDQQQTIAAIIFQALVIFIFVLMMALAVGVIFASFHDRNADAKSWLACAVSGFVMLGALISIIESTTSIRTDGQSYGWPFGRDYRQFGHRGDMSFLFDRRLDNNQIAALHIQIVTNLGARTNPDLALPETDRTDEDSITATKFCPEFRHLRHRQISHLIIAITQQDGTKTELIIDKSHCR